MFKIISPTKDDEQTWLNLRKQLWPRCTSEQHVLAMKDYLSSKGKCVFLAVRAEEWRSIMDAALTQKLATKQVSTCIVDWVSQK